MKFPVFNLILTVFLFWVTIQINTAYEEYLAYFLILTVGIIHGSNDIALIKTIKGQKKFNKKYLWTYILLILLNITAFLIWPILALIFFIAISCYHFGEQHFHNHIRTKNYLARSLFFSYGLLIFGLLFYFNSEKTSFIINELIDYRITIGMLTDFMWLGISLTIITYILNRNNFQKGFNVYKEVFLVLLFCLLFKLAALLWAFAIYFIVWHSLPSLQDQINKLYGESNKVNTVRYIKSSFLYWLISIFGLVFLFYGTQFLEVDFVTIFFSFLAAITVPHVIIMYILNRN